MTDIRSDAPAIDLTANDAFNGGHPWDQYAWLREHAPVHWHPEPDGPGFWAITQYADIRTVSRQPRLFSSAARGVMMAEPDDEALAASRQMMLSMDPPQHDRFKLLVSRGFTPRNAQALRRADRGAGPRDRRRRRRARRVRPRPRRRRPAAVGPDRRADGHPPSRRRAAVRAHRDHAHDRRRRRPARGQGGGVAEMLGYGGETAARKRVEPGDDIASTLVQAEIDGDRLSDGELQWFFLLLVNAGGDTTRNLLAAGMQLLFDHPDERARLMADLDGLLPTAVEEMLRYTSPVVHFRRTAMADTVLGEQPIAAGDKVMVFYGVGEPRRGGVRRPGPVRRRPRPQPAHGVRWRGSAPVPRTARRADRDRGDAARAADPPPRSGAGGAPPAAGVELHHRRPDDARHVHTQGPA